MTYLDITQEIEAACTQVVVQGGSVVRETPCEPSALRGVVHAQYTNGAAILSPLILYGAPGTVFRLLFTAAGVAGNASLFAGIEPCRALEAFSEQARQQPSQNGEIQ